MPRICLFVLMFATLGCSAATQPPRQRPPSQGCSLRHYDSEEEAEQDLQIALRQLELSIKTLEKLDLMKGEILGIPIDLEVHYKIEEAKEQAVELRLLLHEMKSQP